MAKRIKDYTKITCICEQADYDAIAIVDSSLVEEMKRRIVKSLADFVNIYNDEITFYFNIEANTSARPEEGTDILYKPKRHVKPQHVEEEIDVIDLGE